MPALPLTKEQLEDAARLKELFLQWQKRQKEAGLPSSQESASEQMGFNQSAMSQYLNGKIPLNIGAAAKFADLLGCQVMDLSPAIADDAARYAFVTQGSERVKILGRVDARAPAGNIDSRPRATHPGVAQAAPKLQWVTEQEAELLSEFRAAKEADKKIILDAARGAPKAKALVIARDKTQAH